MSPSSHARGLGRVETRTAVLFDRDRPLRLESGAVLAPVEVAFETYGRLDDDRANAVCVLHALTGDAHAAGHHGDPGRRGWWDTIIGPGRPLDTDRLHVVCANLLGGCRGTTGPSSIDPSTGRPYGGRFPELTVRDLVTVHRALARHLGIDRFLTAIGGSLGGMQALQWMLDAPDELASTVLICASARLSAQNIGFSAVARHAIETDPDFHGGDYAAAGVRPWRGLSVARMTAHITYLSEGSLRRRFDRRPQDGGSGELQIESYLRHQGSSFVERFDANTYLRFTRLMDRFEPFADPAAGAPPGPLPPALVLSFDTDWRFGTAHSVHLARELAARGCAVERREIASPDGHDSFLLPVPEYHRAVAGFLDLVAAQEGTTSAARTSSSADIGTGSGRSSPSVSARSSGDASIAAE